MTGMSEAFWAFISSRFSFITTVDFTRSPDMPTTSALCSLAAEMMVAMGCLMPMLMTL